MYTMIWYHVQYGALKTSAKSCLCQHNYFSALTEFQRIQVDIHCWSEDVSNSWSPIRSGERHLQSCIEGEVLSVCWAAMTTWRAIFKYALDASCSSPFVQVCQKKCMADQIGSPDAWSNMDVLDLLFCCLLQTCQRYLVTVRVKIQKHMFLHNEKNDCFFLNKYKRNWKKDCWFF